MDAKARPLASQKKRLRPPKRGHGVMTSKGHMGAELELDEKVTETKIDIFLEGAGRKKPKA